MPSWANQYPTTPHLIIIDLVVLGFFSREVGKKKKKAVNMEIPTTEIFPLALYYGLLPLILFVFADPAMFLCNLEGSINILSLIVLKS